MLSALPDNAIYNGVEDFEEQQSVPVMPSLFDLAATA
jgi:hypothetical protein